MFIFSSWCYNAGICYFKKLLKCIELCSVYISVYVCTYACKIMFVCVYIYINIYIHTQIHKYSPLNIQFLKYLNCCIQSLSHIINSSKPSNHYPHRPALIHLNTPHNIRQSQSLYLHQPTVHITTTHCCSLTNTTLSKLSSDSDSQQSNRMYKQFNSVLFKPCSLLGKSTQQTATGCSQYTAGYIRCFNKTKSTTFQFHSPTHVSFRNYSITVFSPRMNQSLYLYFPAFFIHWQVRKATNGQ